MFRTYLQDLDDAPVKLKSNVLATYYIKRDKGKELTKEEKSVTNKSNPFNPIHKELNG